MNCTKCNQLLRPDTPKDYHNCPPRYDCWDQDNGDSDYPDILFTWSGPDSAAEKFAENQDTADGPYEGNVVVKSEDGQILKFEITHDYSINYYAYKVK